MHSHQRARFGFCNDHIWQLNAFKMVFEVGLRAGSDTGYRASGALRFEGGAQKKSRQVF